jgi:hypothetical protein
MNKTDRELLQAAAKAAGYSVARLSDDDSALCLVGVQQAWNPLADDGDALRLAVKLGIGVLFDLQDEKITAYQQQPHDGYNVEFAGDDGPVAATRRAIVRAAAAMVEKT